MIEAICATVFAVAVLVSLLRFYKAKPLKSIAAMIFIWLVAVAWATDAVVGVIDGLSR